MTGDIKIADIAADTNVAFKNCAPFTRCVTHVNDEHVETAENLDIIMNLYNLIEYSDNYAESSGSLYQFKRDESSMNTAGNNCVMYGADTYASGDNANNRETIFQITSTKLYVPVVTLSTKDNVNLTKQLNEGFKRSVYWNEYKS